MFFNFKIPFLDHSLLQCLDPSCFISTLSRIIPKLSSLFCFPYQNWLLLYTILQSWAKWKELIQKLIYEKILMENNKLKCNKFFYILVTYSTNIYYTFPCSWPCRRNCEQNKSKTHLIPLGKKMWLVWGSCDTGRPKEQWRLLVHLKTIILRES